MNSAVLLSNPKYPHNVGAILRSCSCYGTTDLLYTGDRLDFALSKMDRIPREERMKGYADVSWRHSDRPFDWARGAGLIPVAVEVREDSEMLQNFVHPENALYVFGPEDGSLGPVVTRHCQRFVAIPTRHCLNLATCVSTVLYDRMAKMTPDLRLDMAMTEGRGWGGEGE